MSIEVITVLILYILLKYNFAVFFIILKVERIATYTVLML